MSFLLKVLMELLNKLLEELLDFFLDKNYLIKLIQNGSNFGYLSSLKAPKKLGFAKF
jgi:hypothetical protein